MKGRERAVERERGSALSSHGGVSERLYVDWKYERETKSYVLVGLVGDFDRLELDYY